MRTTTAEARRQCLSLRRFIPSGLGSAGRWLASIALAEAGPASHNALSEHCEREGYLGLSRLMEVPRPLLALPVQRPGCPATLGRSSPQSRGRLSLWALRSQSAHLMAYGIRSR